MQAISIPIFYESKEDIATAEVNRLIGKEDSIPKISDSTTREVIFFNPQALIITSYFDWDDNDLEYGRIYADGQMFISSLTMYQLHQCIERAIYGGVMIKANKHVEVYKIPRNEPIC